MTTPLRQPLAVPLEERLVRQRPSDRAPYADNLRLQPQSWPHPGCADPFDQPFESTLREPLDRRPPLADGVPPAAALVVIPAGIDTEDLRAEIRGGLDQRQLALGRRVRHQPVEEVVVDDRGVPMWSPDPPPVCGQRGRDLLDIVADRNSNGNGPERLADLQPLRPLVLGRGRSGRRQIHRAVPISELIMPGTVVLDLPAEQPSGAQILQHPHRQSFRRRPTARARHRNPVLRARLVVVDHPDVVQPQFTERRPPPPELTAPRIRSLPQRQFVLPAQPLTQPGQRQTRHIVQYDAPRSRSHLRPGVENLARDRVVNFDHQPAVVIGEVQSQSLHTVLDVLLPRFQPQSLGRESVDVPLARRAVPSAAGEGELDHRQGRTEAGIEIRRWIAGSGQRHEAWWHVLSVADVQSQSVVAPLEDRNTHVATTSAG